MHHKPGYNERLFSGGLRRWIHEARFLWLKRLCLELGLQPSVVLELGCFDARSISYLPIRPARYYGIDANWEGGLDSAKQAWRAEQSYFFQLATRPEHLEIQEKVNLALSLETLEHIEPELVDGYLQRIAEALKEDGVFLVTVPNERGAIFLAKYLAKRVFFGDGEVYSPMEVFDATLGRMSRVRRFQHKGFDWMLLHSQLATHFDVVKVEGVQFPNLPIWANAQVGFVMRSKRK